MEMCKVWFTCLGRNGDEIESILIDIYIDTYID